LLLESLRQAVASLKRRLGSDMAGWAWGRLHHVYYESALGQATDSATRSLLDVGPLPIGGDGYTVHNTSYRESDFRQTGGATYRQVIDLSDWDRSFVLNSPGQSGDPHSSHYRDLFPLSVEGTYVPLLFSRAKIMDAAEHIIVLLPETAARDH
jgi:penicillin amidase